MAERVQKTLEDAKSNPVPELEGEALLEDYQTADDDDEEVEEKRRRVRAERVANGLSPFVNEEDHQDDPAVRRAWMKKDVKDFPAAQAAFAKIEENRTTG